MINALNIKLMFLLIVVLLANGCQKKTDAPNQLQNESVHYDLSDKSTVGNNLTSEIDKGIVNDNTVRIRDQPSLDAAIIGELDQGMKVSVLGRSQNRVFLDGYDSFWLRIRKDNIEGWAYGAYINLTNTQYDLLPVIRWSMLFAGTVDLNYSRDLPLDELIQKERETISLQSARFLNCSVEEYYNAIASTFELRQNLRPFFLNTIRVGLTDTDRSFSLNTSILCDYIQSSYIDNISISPLAILNETTAAFVISGFEKRPVFTGPITAVSICIRKIENANFDPLNGKTVIDNMAITGYTPESHFMGDIDKYYSYMTMGIFKTEYSVLLEMILDNVIYDDLFGFNYVNADVIGGTLIIPQGTTSIPEERYRERNIQNINFPQSLTYIGMNAFRGNELRNIYLPENLKSIEMGAFRENQLRSIIIPDNVENIAVGAFADNELVEITISRNMSSISSDVFANNLLEKIVIPDNIKVIHEGAFTSNRIVEITIGANVGFIYYYRNNIFGEFDEKFCAYYAGNNRIGGLYRYNENIQEWEYIE